MEDRGSRTTGDRWVAADRRGRVEIRFTGRGRRSGRAAVLAEAGGAGLELSWCRQVHSDRVLEAAPGDAGEGDALITRRPGLALCVAVADCVPVLLAAPDRIAAVHAGWRGIAAGIVPRVLDRLGTAGATSAWIGPAIGPCCYEVGEEVAARVAAASAPRVIGPGAGERPHLDLRRAVELQLTAGAVEVVRRFDECTRCEPALLWSYRRDGSRAGRNLAFVWLAERA